MTDQSDLPSVTTAGDASMPDAPAPSLVLDLDAPAPAELVELAHASGVATEFWDWQGAYVPVSTRTIIDVLASLDVIIRTPADVLFELQEARLRPWRLLLPDVAVVREGETAKVPVHIDEDLSANVEVWFEPEDGGEPRRLAKARQEPVVATVDGRSVSQLVFDVPDDLPLGWHALRVRVMPIPVPEPLLPEIPTQEPLGDDAETGQAGAEPVVDAEPTTESLAEPATEAAAEPPAEGPAESPAEGAAEAEAEAEAGAEGPPQPETDDVAQPVAEAGGESARAIDVESPIHPTPPVHANPPLDLGPPMDLEPVAELARPYVVTPAQLELPAAVTRDRAWGFMTQLYSVRSRQSWGLGDLADLKELVGWSAREYGAGFTLVNPLHAAQPIPPMEASPYLPTTRRFFNPIYLRVEDIREVAYLPSTERAIVEWQAEALQALNTDPGQLDRDAVWAAKSAALQSVFAQPRSRERQASFDAFCTREGQGLADFAMWSVLAERYGLPTDNWPAHALDPHGDAVQHMHFELADEVRFHMWLQWCLDEQLAAVAQVAKDAGMPIGVIHDLAVGVHPGGSDAWALRDVLAHDVTAGAPPDAFNQQGQDWSQPPWRPDRLVELGYVPYRDMLRTVLRHAGALRIDHILGLFRFWWVPRGNSPADGTYVRYDHEALIGILALEAWRAGAFVVGEDLGTVEPWVRDYLAERGVLGTSILWFEKDGEGRPLQPQSWRELCLATVTTHDLPPTAGYLAGEHVELRERLGLLTRPLAEEWAFDEADRQAVLDQLTDLGLLGEAPTERDKIEALHTFLTLTPSRLIGVALADAVGDRRTMNQPGTSTEYPNWRLPLADGVGQPMLLEDLMDAIRVISLARTIDSPLHHTAAPHRSDSEPPA